MPEGQKAGPKGRQIEVGAQRAPRLLVLQYYNMAAANDTSKCTEEAREVKI